MIEHTIIHDEEEIETQSKGVLEGGLRATALRLNLALVVLDSHLASLSFKMFGIFEGAFFVVVQQSI